VKRTYIFAALLFLIGAGAGIYGIITSRVLIDDATTDDLALAGRLVIASEEDGVRILDLSSGNSEVVFTADPKSLLTYAALSPDGTTLAITYAPPSEGIVQAGYTNLYTLPLDASTDPQLVVEAGRWNTISNPAFSADSNSITYTHTQTLDAGLRINHVIDQVSIQSGEVHTIIDEGYASSLSADGEQLAYITTPESSTFDTLYVSSAAGEAPTSLADGDLFLAIDTPIFSPDGSTIAFSAQERESLISQGIDVLFGVQQASAHTEGVADIWAVSTSGGEPYKLAILRAQGLHLSYSPDGQYIAFVSTQGLYIMQSDGTRLFRLQETDGLRSVHWVE